MTKRRTKADRAKASQQRRNQLQSLSFRQKNEIKRITKVMADVDVPQIKRDLLKTTVVTVIVLTVLLVILRYT